MGDLLMRKGLLSVAVLLLSWGKLEASTPAGHGALLSEPFRALLMGVGLLGIASFALHWNGRQ